MNDQVSPAVVAAQTAQARVNACLAANTNFRLEAGAGAGKTYSLVEALQKIIAERGPALMHAGQRVACITYTEVARNEIAQEVEEHPAILVDTIHGFGWAFIKNFQKALRELIAADPARQEAIEAADGIQSQTVEYSFGFFNIDENRITLSHDDVPRYLGALIARPKFQRLFTSLFPVLFIDEYQDTDPLVMNALVEHFFAPGTGPMIGLFGDHWQTIYRRDYELLDLPNVEGIDKGSNFRSVPAIVTVLNAIRPDLLQAVDDPNAVGEARFFHCNGFTGARVNSAHAKEELPQEDLALAVERVRDVLAADNWDFDPAKTKVLLLTHNAIAANNGYPNIAKIFDRNEAFAKKEDPVIEFLADTVEPVCEAYAAGRYGDMFRLMGGVPLIRQTADKSQWRADLDALVELRNVGTIGQVIDHLRATRRPRLSDRVVKREDELAAIGPDPKEDEPSSISRHRMLRDVPYAELVAVTKFINGFTPFATQHSVKGAQFENVLVILSGGWNHYNWPRLLEYLAVGNVPANHQAGYLRARNLLYVALSRPEKRLAVLATQQLSPQALQGAECLFGQNNVYALPMVA